MKVIIDSREKTPWQFNHPDVTSAEVRKLHTGDYSIEGLEDILCIERKKTVAELATCATSERFKRELERMLDYKYRYLILEFDEEEIMRYPVGSFIPKNRWKKLKIKGGFIMKFLQDISQDYGVKVVLAGSSTVAERKIVEIMKKVCENECT
jgi:ERCC4-type nuclease